jgi:xanthine dehydrogenase accessory factor
MAATVGYAVTVVDDRARFATPDRFPCAREVMVRDFVDAISAVEITPWTSVVLVTRGHEHDETCLAQVAASPARYVGMIGSRRRVKVVNDRLREVGVPVEALDRVHAPIGLDLGGRSPAELALAILAEVVAVRWGGNGSPLSHARVRGCDVVTKSVGNPSDGARCT